MNWQTSAKVQLGKINGISNDVGSLKSWRNATNQKINTIDAGRKKHDAWAWDKYVETGKKFGEDRKRIGNIEEDFKKQKSWQWDRYVEQNGKFAEDRKRLDGLEARTKKHDSWAWDRYVEQNGKFAEDRKRLDDIESGTKEHNAWAWDRYQETNGKFAEDRKNIDDVQKRVKRNSDDIKNLMESGAGWTDAAIIASINFQGKANTDLWNAENYDGGSINEKDGKAVRLFKVQFQGLKSHISAMLKTYFGKEGLYTEVVQSPLKRIIELLELIKDKKITMTFPESGIEVVDLKDNFIRLMTLLNTLLHLIETNKEDLADVGLKDSLKRIIELLEAIRDKKMTVEIPPIEIPEIKIPEINLSEKGNGWLKTLIKTVGGIIETAIKTMGEVLGKAIDGVSENLGKLIDLVQGLLDDLMKLIVPENLDFMNKRFDGFQKKIKVKFDFLFSGIDGFKGLFSNQKKIEDIDFSLGVFGNGESVSIPLSWINKFAPYVRPIITGFIALEFLIDMYKWFHMRGEVVE